MPFSQFFFVPLHPKYKRMLLTVRLEDLITPEMVNRNWDILYQTRA